MQDATVEESVVKKMQATTQKEKTKMTPSNTMKVQRQVFDLATFDAVDLVKEIAKPAPVTSIEEAMQAVGQDASVLMSVINDGIEKRLRDAAYNEITGFKVIDENGEAGEDYTGTYAEGDRKKVINNGILVIAKMQAGGSWDTLTAEQKSELKDKAKAFIRSNPAMVESLQK